MADAAGKIEVLIVNDGNGNSYAIPRDMLEKHRLTEDQKALVEQEASGDDVSGFRLASVVQSDNYADAAADRYASAQPTGSVTGSSNLFASFAFVSADLFASNSQTERL